MAGIEAAGNDYELLVSIDAGHRAPPGWLKELARPIALGKARICTAYHRAWLPDSRLVGLGMLWCTGVLGLMQGKLPLRQTWGGSTAITRQAFEELHVAGQWSRTVVDDLTLTALARRAKESIALSPVWLESDVQGLSMKKWFFLAGAPDCVFKIPIPLLLDRPGPGRVGVLFEPAILPA